MQQEERALMRARMGQAGPRAGCVGIGLYDVQPGGGMYGSDIIYPLTVCLCVCMWTRRVSGGNSCNYS